MSSVSATTRSQERVARLSLGAETGPQQGRSLRRHITHPEQLRGPRARNIRPGTVRSAAVAMRAPIVVGIDVSKPEFCVPIDPSGEPWTSATAPAGIDALV